MTYIPKTKHGNCSTCNATNTSVVKIKKSLHCLACNRAIKTGQQISKANERDKQRRQSATSTQQNQSSKVRSLINSEKNKEVVGDNIVGSKSELLWKADRLFADFIKSRDTKNGKITCPCCNITFDADKVDSDGNKVANCMHFVDRNVYSLRFDEDAAAAGHSACNRNQHFSPLGKEYQNFKKHLVDKFGGAAVVEMELQKRKINKLEIQQLKVVIEHYG